MAAHNDDLGISVSRSDEKPWNITALRLKLALKYGLEGPWEAPNWSVAFDAYALGRGPDKGLPNLADFLMTQLMNSRVGSLDLIRMTRWLRRKATEDHLGAIRDCLSKVNGMDCLQPEAIRLVGQLVDRMASRDEPGVSTEDGRRSLHGIGRAKAFKWLAAWAPAHIPMIDKVVEDALVKMKGDDKSVAAEELLTRFQCLLKGNMCTLSDLGEWLHRRLGNQLPRALPPVRVLDSLLWCDWWAFWGPRPKDELSKPPFEYWVVADGRDRTQYELTAAGRELQEKLCVD